MFIFSQSINVRAFSVAISKTSNISTNPEILNNESRNLSTSSKIYESSNVYFSEEEYKFNNATIRNNG